MKIDNSGESAPEIRPGSQGDTLVDAAKIQKIKQTIVEGRFKIDTGVVADRLIQSVLDLISSRKD